MTTPNRYPYDRTSFILIVDDDNTLLKFFKIHLNKLFSRIIVVKNAKEAIDSLKEKDVDLVLTDVRMPRMDGIQLMAKVRKFDPLIPVLLISGAMLTEEQIKSCHNDADGYLRKPFTVEELHDFLYKGIEKRTKLLKLSEMIPDKKAIRELLNGKIKLEKLLEEKEIGAAEQILQELKAS